MKFKNRIFYCGTCKCLSIKCDDCGSTSCAGNGCKSCHSDFKEFIKFIDQLGEIEYHAPFDWDKDVPVCKQ